MAEVVEKPLAGRHSADERIGVLEELLGERFSCRAFRPEPVPRATIERILNAAQKTASWCNSQPWRLEIASGAATKKFRDVIHAAASSGKPNTRRFSRSRANIAASIWSAAARAAFSSTTRSAFRAATRRATPGRRWRISISSARRTSPSFIPTKRSASTARSIAAATSRASCWRRRRWAWPRCRRRRWHSIPKWCAGHFGLGDDRRVVCGISFGFADREHKANSYRTSRADIADTVTFVDE